MMNSNRRAEAKRMQELNPDLKPKQIYEMVKVLKIKGKRK